MQLSAEKKTHKPLWFVFEGVQHNLRFSQYFSRYINKINIHIIVQVLSNRIAKGHRE